MCRQTRLEANGAARKLAASCDLSAVRPLLDDDLRRAIASLEVSTSAIEKQTALLKQQWQYLDEHGQESGKTRAAQTKAAERLDNSATLEEQQLRLATEELIQEISKKLSMQQHQLQSRMKSTTGSITERLKDDDRALNRVEKVAATLATVETAGGPDKEVSSRAASLASILAHLRTETLQSRLDRVYLETLYDTSAASRLASAGVEHDEIAMQQKSLQDELDSLYSEIQGLAAMSVEQEFKAPIMEFVTARERIRQETTEAQHVYVLDTLATLTRNLTTTAEDIETYQAYRTALSAVAKTLPAISELFPKQKPESEAESDLSTAQLDTLLRHAGLPTSSAPSLSTALKDRLLRLMSSPAFPSTSNKAILAALYPFDQTHQLLTGALHADSTTGKPSLTDAEMENILREVEAQVAGLGKAIETTNIDMAGVSEYNMDIEKGFVERWAG